MENSRKRFNTKRGYGFITNSDGKDVFIHHSDIRMKGDRYFNKGDIVNFHVLIVNDGREHAIASGALGYALVLGEETKKKYGIS